MRIRRNIRLIGLFNFFTDFDVVAPIAILYYTRVSGSYALGMSVFSLMFLCAAVFEIPTGVLSDKLGRKYTMVAGTIASILSAVFIAIGGAYLNLVLGAICAGLARSFYSGNNHALLYETLHQLGIHDRYHEKLGKTSSLFQVALAISAAIGSILASISFSLVMWIAVIPKVCMFVVSLFLVEPEKTERSDVDTNVYAHMNEALQLIVKNKKLRLLTIAASIKMAFSESMYVFRATFIEMLWPIWAVGFVQMFSNIGAFVGQYFSGRLIDRISYKKVLYLEMAYNRSMNLIALLLNSPVSPALMTTTSVMWGAGEISLNSLQQQEFSHKQRATMGSFVALTKAVSFGVVSFFVGLIADSIGPRNILIIANILLATPLIIYAAIFKEKRQHTSS